MANMDIVDGKYVLTQNIAAAGTKTISLATENKFVDKNIDINVVTPAGAMTGTPTTAAAVDVEGILTESSTQPASGEYITVTAQGTVVATTGGFIAQGTSANSEAATKYYTVQDAAFSVQGPSVVSTQKGYVGNGVTVGTVSSGAQTITGGGLSAGAQSTTVASNGYYDGSSYDASDKVTLSTSEAAGYYKITGSGSATVNRAAVTKQVTTAGYFTADADPVSAISADSLTVATPDQAYFIKKSTLSTNSVTPSTTSQTITVGEGYAPADRTITVAAMAAGAATPGFANTGLATYFNAGTSGSNDVSITPQYMVTTAGYLAATSEPVDGTPSYYSIKTTAVVEGTTTVSGTSATRGSASWNEGWITAGGMDAAVFANSATSGKTYVDISGTTAAPVLVSGDYLYINKGYTDDLKISLAKLVPDGSDVKGHSEYILSGHSAYDDDGTLVAGSIQTYLGEYTVA